MVEAETVEKTSTETAGEAALYELGYIVIPTVGEDGVAAEAGKVREVLEKYGGTPFSEEFPVRKALAYEMSRGISGARKRFTEGYFGWMKFTSDASAIDDMHDELARNERLLRCMIIHAGREQIRPYAPRARDAKGDAVLPKKITKREQPKGATIEGETGMTDAELDKTIEDLVIE